MSPSRFEWIIYGSGLSSLVLAERLSSAGDSVGLVNPTSSWGGVFSGIEIKGQTFDIGMTNFEFELFGNEDNADIASYDVSQRNDSTRFVRLVKDYVLQHVDVHQIPTPQMLVAQAAGPDLVITNQFEILRKLPLAQQTRIQQELREICSTSSLLHASRKSIDPQLFLESSLEEVSLANHGRTIHESILDPVCQKVLGVPSRDISALYHRSAWVPLFYPETLLSQFSATPQELKPTTFHYPYGQHFGSFMGQLYMRVKSSPRVQVITGEPATSLEMGTDIRLRTKNGLFGAKHIVWAADLESLESSASLCRAGVEPQFPKKKADLDLFFVKIRSQGVRKLFSVMLDADPISPFYRITNQSVCSGRSDEEHLVILECNSKSIDPITSHDGANSLVSRFFDRYDMDFNCVSMLEHRQAKGVLMIPSPEGKKRFDKKRLDVLAKVSNVSLMGSATMYTPPTLNDHVVQALNIFNELKGPLK